MKRLLTWSETTSLSAPLSLSADGKQSFLMVDDLVEWQRDCLYEPVANTRPTQKKLRRPRHVLQTSQALRTGLLVLLLSLVAAGSLMAALV